MSALKESNGLWRYQKTVVHPVTGEKKRLRKRGFTSKRECEISESQAIVEFTNEIKQLKHLPINILIDEFLRSKKTIKATSYYKLKGTIDLWVRPLFKDFDAYQFSVKEAGIVYDRLLALNTSDNNKNAILKNCKSIFKFMDMEYGISALPMERLKVLKVYKNRHRKFNVYDIAQFERFNQTFDESDLLQFTLKVLFNVLFWTGVRRGEAKGLTWKDIWFESNEIDINKQFIDKHPLLGRTLTDVKSESSVRTILTDKITMNLLTRLKEWRKLEPNFSENDFVFLRSAGELPLPDITIDRTNSRHAKKANLKRIRVHDFRHSFASVNFSLKADVASVSRQMGHSSVAITMDIYITMIDKRNEDRVENLNEARSKVLSETNL